MFHKGKIFPMVGTPWERTFLVRNGPAWCWTPSALPRNLVISAPDGRLRLPINLSVERTSLGTDVLVRNGDEVDDIKIITDKNFVIIPVRTGVKPAYVPAEQGIGFTMCEWRPGAFTTPKNSIMKLLQYV